MPGESPGQRSLAGYSPWGRTESDMTEWLSTCHTIPGCFMSVHPNIQCRISEHVKDGKLLPLVTNKTPQMTRPNFIRGPISLKVKVLVVQSCPTLCDPTDCSPLGSSVHGILQARILEWVAIPFSRVSSQPRDQTQVSHITGRFFTIWATSKILHPIPLRQSYSRQVPGGW